MKSTELASLDREIIACRFCPRLVEHREEVARQKRRAYVDWDYWGKPLPGFGDARARLLVIGLAPGAHGANRTGRVFTGDRSGLWLYRALHRAGLANRPTSEHRDDGLELKDCYITLAARCVPPQNKLMREEIDRCRPFLYREHGILTRVKVVLALGHVAFASAVDLIEYVHSTTLRPKPKFAHGAVFELGDGRPRLVGSYHPSQQNTSTGRLTEAMFDEAITKALPG